MCLQRDLQLALLQLGTWDAAARDFLSWAVASQATLAQVTPHHGDTRALDIELAKLRVGEVWKKLYLAVFLFSKSCVQ